MLSLVIPVYKNQANLESLLAALEELNRSLPEALEVVIVVDGSPDDSLLRLREELPQRPLQAVLISLSRNYGAFSAIAAGLAQGSGDYFAVIAADLQEPPELVGQFLEKMRGGADVVFGHRLRRADPFLSTFFSTFFWFLYRRWVLPEIPPGGVDVFGCTRRVRDELLKFPETNTNLIAQLFWVGFRRAFVGYERRERREGKSAWSFVKRLRYSLDSIFSFTDLPLLVLLTLGGTGIGVAGVAGTIVFLAWLRGLIPQPGYTPVVLTVMFFGSLTTLGLGIVGQYVRLAMENARRRPNFIVDCIEGFHCQPAAESSRTRISEFVNSNYSQGPRERAPLIAKRGRDQHDLMPHSGDLPRD